MNTIESLREKLAHYVDEQNNTAYWDYDTWKLYSQPKILDLIVSALYSRLKVEKVEFDAIAGLGTSGMPIASFLSHNFSTEINKEKTWHSISPPSVGLASRWVKKIKPEIPKRSKVLLVDSEVKSGNTAYDGFKKIEAAWKEADKLHVEAFLVMCDYVTYKERDLFEMFKQESGARIIKLFDFTPTYEHHKEEVDFQTRLSWFTPQV